MSSGNIDTKKQGLILVACAFAAIIVCNTSLQPYYAALLNISITFGVDDYELSKPLLLWVNEGLMAVFFCYVTLEIKREMLSGSLSSTGKRILPFWAAVGGMLLPALCYLWVIGEQTVLIPGWAIPTATDIVFALCLLSVAYPAAPTSVRSFLLALAVFDDIGAILIIALYYSNQITWLSIILVILLCSALALMRRKSVNRLFPYLSIAILLWLVVLKSGVHATLAGILVALVLPDSSDSSTRSLSDQLEAKLNFPVNFIILPIFAFVNSGVSFTGTSLSQIFDTLPIAITFGLFFGKQVGITLASYIAVQLRIATLPNDMRWLDVYGVSIICGIGFTMSLFIGTLAFDETAEIYALWVRVGVIFGSLLAALYAYVFYQAIHKKYVLHNDRS